MNENDPISSILGDDTLVIVVLYKVKIKITMIGIFLARASSTMPIFVHVVGNLTTQ